MDAKGLKILLRIMLRSHSLSLLRASVLERHDGPPIQAKRETTEGQDRPPQWKRSLKPKDGTTVPHSSEA